MPSFDIRTTAPTKDNKKYPNGPKGQCTYGSYYRIKEIGWPAPCHYYNGNPGYGNAKDWPENIEPDWEAHYVSDEPNYIPAAGDICVFNGKYGHVIFLEEALNDNNYLISQWNKDSNELYSSDIWQKGTIIIGKEINTGPVKCYMHYKNNIEGSIAKPVPIDRDIYKIQLQVIDSAVNVRVGAGKNYPSLGYAEPGYYNVFETKLNTEDGYTWCKVGDYNWIAVIANATYGDSTKIFPAVADNKPSDDIESLKKQLDNATAALNDYEARLSQIVDIATLGGIVENE